MNEKEMAWLDQEDARVAHNIRTAGVHIEYVIGGDCGATCSVCDAGPATEETPFAYTVGLFGMGHPELLVFGLTPGGAQRLLNDMTARIRAGGDLVPGLVIDEPQFGRRLVAEEVPNPGAIVFTANRHYCRPDEVSVPVLQLSWEDHAGHFPWDPAYSLPDWLQPRPGEFAA